MYNSVLDIQSNIEKCLTAYTDDLPVVPERLKEQALMENANKPLSQIFEWMNIRNLQQKESPAWLTNTLI